MLNHFRNFTLAVALLLAATAVYAESSPRETVSTALLGSGADVRGIYVTQVEDIVIVRGNVPTRSDLERVHNALGGVQGERIANLVGITARPDDKAIERKVERALSLSPSLDGCRFHLVSSDRGVVRIEGTVRSDLQRDIALSIARELEGVRQVEAFLKRV